MEHHSYLSAPTSGEAHRLAEHIITKLQETIPRRRSQFCSQNCSVYILSYFSGVPERSAAPRQTAGSAPSGAQVPRTHTDPPARPRPALAPAAPRRTDRTHCGCCSCTRPCRGGGRGRAPRSRAPRTDPCRSARKRHRRRHGSPRTPRSRNCVKRNGSVSPGPARRRLPSPGR